MTDNYFVLRRADRVVLVLHVLLGPLKRRCDVLIVSLLSVPGFQLCAPNLSLPLTHPHTLKTISKRVLVPIMTYGIPIWIGAIKKETLKNINEYKDS